MLEEYFAGGDTQPEDIDFVIYTRGNSLALGDPWSMTDDQCINVPYFLQEKFKMSNAQVFNVEQVCAGTLVACRLALSLIGDGSVRKILLLSSNFFRDPRNRLMGGLGLVSDGVGVMEIFAGNTRLSMVDFIGKTDGSITMVKAYREGTNPATIVQVGCDIMNQLAQRNNLKLKDISLIIPQNISNSGWNFYCQLLDFPKENVFLETFADGGHMADVDIIRNLTEVRRTRPLSPGDYALIYGLGTGTSWSALLLREL
jgi:3-oxoacyl-[acyl-carrier-protein] synthase III